MAAPTQPVTCRFFDQDGAPIAARVSFKLTTPVVYIDADAVPPDNSGLVAATTTQYVTCDPATGIGVINLFPNELGVTASQYTVKAVDSVTGRKILAESLCSVPNSPCHLALILNQEPFPSLDAAAIALAAVQAAVATAAADVGNGTLNGGTY